MNSSVSAWKGSALLLSACIIWGCQFPVSKAVLTVIDPMELVFLRLVIGVLCLLIIGLFCHVSWKIERQHWPLLLLMSLSGYVISIWAQFYGTALTTSQISAVIMSTIPIGMVILSRLILKEHITRRKGLAVCTATAGVIIIIGIGDIEPSQQFGGLLLLLAVITVALMMVLVKKYHPLLHADHYHVLHAHIRYHTGSIRIRRHSFCYSGHDVRLASSRRCALHRHFCHRPCVLFLEQRPDVYVPLLQAACTCSSSPLREHYWAGCSWEKPSASPSSSVQL